MTDPERPNQGSLGVPDVARDLPGPGRPTGFPSSVAPRGPDAASALGGSRRRSPTSHRRVPPGHAQCGRGQAPPPPQQRPRPLCPGQLGSAPADFPPPRAARACPVRAQRPRPWERPGSSPPSGAEENPSSPRWARGRAGAGRRSCRVGAGSAEPGHRRAAGPWA